MEDKTSQLFFDYIPASELIKAFEIHQRDLIVRAMRKQVVLHYPVKSDKYLTYYPIEIKNTRLKPIWTMLRTFFIPSTATDERIYRAGQIIPIEDFYSLNALGSNTLSESLLFSHCAETDSFMIPYEFLWRKFYPISFSDILVHFDDALELRQLIINEKKEIENEQPDSNEKDTFLKPKTKQAQREEVFLAWLQGKNKAEVSHMKKDDVWLELQEIDRRLFNVEPKNFFRDQNIITFKSGRKAG